MLRQTLKSLASMSPPIFIMGGLAEDALLHGRVTREHADLDILITREELSLRWQQLQTAGLAGPDVKPAFMPGRPLVIGDFGSISLEIWVCDPAPDGGYWLDVPGRERPGLFRVSLPHDTFRHPATTIDGVPIQTVSPWALYQLRAASALTRDPGEKQAHDLAAQERLRRAFLAGKDEIELRLGIAG